MRIGINGCGVAGPTLAYWLQRHGHEPVLFEKAPALRTGGYVIDFWGIGYHIAERMGLLDRLHERGYRFEEVRMVDARGDVRARMNIEVLAEMTGGRFVSIPRGDIARTLYEACGEVETHFGRHVTALEERSDGVDVKLDDGSTERFDLVVGADGLHSTVRRLMFGDVGVEHELGACVAAFRMTGYAKRDEKTYVMHNVPERQVARVALRNDETLFLFVCRSSLVEAMPTSPAEIETTLHAVFGGMGWEVDEILAQLDQGHDLYFDRVSQIRLGGWTKGRAALIGDAAACVSFLAGEGTGLAMAEAYVLAGELGRADGNHELAFRRYEECLAAFLADKQKSATRMLGFFVPKTAVGVKARDWMVRLTSNPTIAKLVAGDTVRDDIDLPHYEA